MEDIFIQVAAYRDEDTPATLEDLISKAKHPERLHFGVFLQLKPDDPDEWYELPKHPSVEIQWIDADDSQGACWARTQAQRMYSDERYWLQIDSHMRAVEDWDELLIDMWKSTDDPKAVLSAYPNGFKQPCELNMEGIPLMEANKFNEHGLLVFEAKQFHVTPDKPVPGAFVAGGYIFGPGQIIEEVPYDPDIYFYGEEISLAVRLFTHGYNVYNPNKNLLFHLYKKGGGAEPTHWGDHSDWFKLNRKSIVRVHAICGTLNVAPKSLNAAMEDLEGLENYWRGDERTLEEFETMAGIDFKEQRIIDRGAGRRLASNA